MNDGEIAVMRARFEARLGVLLKTGNRGGKFPRTQEGKLPLRAAVMDMASREFPEFEIDPSTFTFDDDWER